MVDKGASGPQAGRESGGKPVPSSARMEADMHKCLPAPCITGDPVVDAFLADEIRRSPFQRRVDRSCRPTHACGMYFALRDAKDAGNVLKWLEAVLQL